MRSRCFFIAVLASVVAPMASHAGGRPVLRVENVEAGPNELFVVGIVMDGARETGALDVELSYDSALMTYVAIAVGSSAANGIVSAREGEPGRLRIALVAADGLSADDEVLRVTFLASEVAAGESDVQIVSATAHPVGKPVATPIGIRGGTARFGIIPPRAADETASGRPGYGWALVIAGGVLIGVAIGMIVRKGRAS